jgi:two-component system LytT family sensor kinase
MTRPDWKTSPMTYWGCQLFGWGGVALFGRIMEALQALASPATAQIQDHRFLPLTCLAGLVASHLLRLLIRRGQWLEMPPAKLILRYALALAASTLLLSVIGVLLFKSPTAQESRTETFTIALMINSSLMGAWMAIYFLFHFYEAFHRAREEQVLLREAVTRSQLEALRLQLNPHFLFNALNSIRALIPPSASEAREGVTRLAGVLQSTLVGKTADTIAFARELEVVRDYLAIEKLRFADHLRIVESIDSALDPIPIPPLMLLTLVENAIKHGVQLHEQAATLSLIGALADGMVTLVVESPGSETQSSAQSSLGIGLRNVRERLQLIYGTEASAVLEAVSASTMRCTLRYPATPRSKP